MTQSAFYHQFEPLTKLLKGFAYTLTKNMDEAKDLYQETAFKAFSNREKYRPDTNLKAWLMTIMKNIFINNYRKKKKQNTLIDTTDNNHYIDAGSQVIRNEGEGNIIMAELVSMIEELEDELKVPFLMHYQGFKYQEIADKYEIPLGTIKSRIFFARAALKDKINKRYQAKSSHAIAS